MSLDDGGPIARAAVELVADTSKFNDDVRRKVTAAASAAGKDFDSTLRAETRDTGASVGDGLSGAMGASGTKSGTAWSSAFRTSLGDLKSLTADMEAASTRLAQARDAEDASTERVLAADKELNDARTKGASDTDAVTAAERKLDAALRDLATDHARVAAATDQHTEAQRRLGTQTDQTTSIMGRLRAALRGAGDDSKSSSANLKSFGSSAKETDNSTSGLLSKLGTLGLAAQGLKLFLTPTLFAELIPPALGLGAAVVQASGALLMLPGVLTVGATAFGAIKIATLGFGAALKDVGDPKKFADDIKDLAPAAQEAAIAIQGLKAPFDNLRKSLQQNLFSGVGPQITATATMLMSTFRPAFESITVTANATLKGFLMDLRGVHENKDLQTIASSSSIAFKNLIAAVRPLGQVFLDVAAVGAKVFASITGGVGGATQRFADFISKIKESGELEKIIRGGLEALKELGQIAGNVGSILISIFKASSTNGTTFLTTLRDSTKALADFAKSVPGQQIFTAFFQILHDLQGLLSNLKIIAPAIAPLLQALHQGLQAVFVPMPAVTAGVRDIIIALTPLLPLAGQVGAAIATGIAVVLTDLAPIIANIVTGIRGFVAGALPGLKLGFAEAWAVAKPLLTVLGDLAVVVLPPLGVALGVISTILGPFAPLIIGVVAATKAWSLGMGLLTKAFEAAKVGFWAADAILKFSAVATSAVTSAATTTGAWLASSAKMVADAVAKGALWLASMVRNFVAAAASAIAQSVISAAAWVAASATMLASQLAKGAVWLAAWIATGVAAAASSVATAAVAAAAWIAANLAMILATGGIILAVAAVVAIGYELITHWDDVKRIAGEVWTAVSTAVSTAVTAVIGFVSNLVSTVTGFVSNLVSTVIGFFGNLESTVVGFVGGLVSSAIGFFGNLESTVVGFVGGLVGSVIGFFGNLAGSVGGAVSGLVGSVIGFFGNMAGQVGGIVSGIVSNVLGLFGNLGAQMWNVGNSIITGIGNGISAGWSYLTGLVSNLATSLFNAAKSALGIGSPSKVFATIGTNSGLGVIQGLVGITPKAIAAARDMAMATAKAAQVALGAITVAAPPASAIAASTLPGQVAGFADNLTATIVDRLRSGLNSAATALIAPIAAGAGVAAPAPRIPTAGALPVTVPRQRAQSSGAGGPRRPQPATSAPARPSDPAAAAHPVTINQNIYNPTVTDATDSSNQALRRFAAMGGFSR